MVFNLSFNERDINHIGSLEQILVTGAGALVDIMSVCMCIE